ncbi:hypothetical protein RHGRI_020335 [Rhododendron griersonianum]|uniref:Tobamovirus multiplication protein 2B n=1 Tax=Rhododendron griersonianum TaxID=479676 RepID=A0AAV6JIT1_9ERIC|nr:hypothetical protein RHGRI_020335 [Rhododendron griersonianum]
MATNSSTPAVPSGVSGGRAASSREGSAKAMVHLAKLPRNLLAKTSTIKNTEQILEQMPRVISSLDAHLDNGLQSALHCLFKKGGGGLGLKGYRLQSNSRVREKRNKGVPHLKTVTQLLANMESCQLKSLSKAPSSQESHIAANMESSLLM